MATAQLRNVAHWHSTRGNDTLVTTGAEHETQLLCQIEMIRHFAQG